jgi:superfamily II DNA helicase RecQ
MTSLYFQALTEDREVQLSLMGLECHVSIPRGHEFVILHEVNGITYSELRRLPDYDELTQEYPTRLLEDDLYETIPADIPEVVAEATPILERVPEVIIPQATPDSPDLFSILSDLRRDLAKEQGVKPYLIFSNKSLQDMTEKRPQDMSSFSKIFGVGKSKLEQYGEIFINAICEAVA